MKNYMQQAYDLALKAQDLDEVPVGAVIVNYEKNEVVGRGLNLTRSDHDPSAHAEIVDLRDAGKNTGSARMPQCDIYVTLEPCPMCAQALSIARIRRIYFGAYDPKSGGVAHGAKIFNATSCHHKPVTCGGLESEKCGDILRQFFRQKRR